ncbi:MAG: DUF2207 domain-containing protein [Clostridiaceae bacterium]|nr:DUF2207 domain-containing protein [Clostridiaceae bacterium]
MVQRHPVSISLGLVVLLIILLTATPVHAAWNASYEIVKYDVQVDLSVKGEAQITETISYRLFDDLTDFHYQLPFGDAEQLQLVKIGVADSTGNTEQPIFVEATPAGASNGNQVLPLTYTLDNDGQKMDIRLHTLSKANTERTVSLTYKMDRIIALYQDTAMLSRRFFVQDMAVPIHNPSLTLIFPEVIPAVQIWSLPSSLADFIMAQPAANQLNFQATGLSAGQSLMLTCLLPAEVFPTAPKAAVSLTRDQLTAAARAEDNQIHQDDSFRTTVYSLIFILIALAAILALLVYWIFDREGAASFRQRYAREIPGQCPPVLMSLLLRKDRPAQLILTALLDLVRRKELAIDGCVFKRLYPDRTDFSGFTASEVYLLQWLFGQMSADQTLSTAQIRRYARSEETSQDFRTYYRQYRALINEELNSRNWIDRKRTHKGRTTAIISAGVYAVLSITATAFLQAPAGLLLMLPALLFILYSNRLCRMTIAGKELYAHSQAFCRYIVHMNQLEPVPDAEFLGHALPYALAVGLSKSYFEQLLKRQDDQLADYLAIYGINRQKDRRPVDQLRAFSEDLRVMESMLGASLLLAEGIHI